MHSKPRRMAASAPASDLKKQPTKGAALVERNRAKLNALTDSQREDFFNKGMQLIYGGGSAKAKVSRG